MKEMVFTMCQNVDRLIRKNERVFETPTKLPLTRMIDHQIMKEGHNLIKTI